MTDASVTLETIQADANFQVVGFTVGNERFGIDILKVQEIIKPVTITRVPNAPDYVEGIISLRNKVVPVVNFRRRFKRATEIVAQREDCRIIIGRLMNTSVGLVVDQVSQVISLPESALSPAPQAVKGFDSAFLKGLARHEEGLLIVLDFEKIFSHNELADLKQAG